MKSLTLDKWTSAEVSTMQTIGNERANAFWEAAIPADFKRPSWEKNEDVAAFINAKYVKRQWVGAKQTNSKPKPKPKSEPDGSDDEMPTFDLLTPVYD